MRIIITAGIACAVVSLAGCSYTSRQLHRHDNDYARGAGTVAHMNAPAGARAHSMGEYYPVPSHADLHGKPPSIKPPGSGLQTSSVSVPKGKTRLVKSKSGDETLVMAANNRVAWSKVGKALKASGYQVLDEDSEMGAYFILDAKETHNKITKQTPILRVNLKANDQQTAISMASHDNAKLDSKISDRVLHEIQKHIG
ncbi:MAG: outer membrane protein assembly factor BamC [Coxiellaceae bacterium]|nr:outer membrane protein assembly factor BamC [Coxiellaceae bacterium]